MGGVSLKKAYLKCDQDLVFACILQELQCYFVIVS